MHDRLLTRAMDRFTPSAVHIASSCGLTPSDRLCRRYKRPRRWPRNKLRRSAACKASSRKLAGMEHRVQMPLLSASMQSAR